MLGALNAIASGLGLLAQHGHAAEGAHAAAAGDSAAQMQELYGHLTAHRYSEVPFAKLGPLAFYFTNHEAAILVASALVLLTFGWLASRRRRDPVARGPIENLLEAMVTFVKDDMVYANMGEKHGRRFLPLFLSQFFCILVMNLFGILPNFDFMRRMHFPTTATANLAVTGGLALVTLTTILYAGIREQGFGQYFVGLAPSIHLGDGAVMKAMKIAILGIMYPIEAIGLLIKPIALTVRLFANMTGGHLAMLTIYGLIYMFQLWWIAPVGVAFNVFLSFLEILVAFIQAYIFTYLSILFVTASVHPQH